MHGSAFHFLALLSLLQLGLSGSSIKRNNPPAITGLDITGFDLPLIDVKLTCASQNTSHPPSGACAFNKMRRQRKAFISMAAVCLRDGTVEKIYYVRPKQTVCCSLEVIFCCSGAGLSQLTRSYKMTGVVVWLFVFSCRTSISQILILLWRVFKRRGFYFFRFMGPLRC